MPKYHGTIWKEYPFKQNKNLPNQLRRPRVIEKHSYKNTEESRSFFFFWSLLKIYYKIAENIKIYRRRCVTEIEPCTVDARADFDPLS